MSHKLHVSGLLPFTMTLLLGLGGLGCAENTPPNALEQRLAHAEIVSNFKSDGPDRVVTTEFVRTLHPQYAGLSLKTKWFLGEYSYSSDTDISVPDREYHISGTDLGSSVHLNGQDFFYLGDTFWPGRVECAREPFHPESMLAAGCAPNACCNDAIVVSNDDDPSDGLDVGIPLVQSRQNGLNFKPLIIPGIHDNPNFLGEFWNRNLDPNYTAPGGSGLVHGLLNHRGPRVLVWYSTAVWPQGRITRKLRPYRAPRSFVAVSENGLDFESLVKDDNGDPVPFSMDRQGAPTRFLCTSPVEITAQQFRTICRDAPGDSFDTTSLLCKLPDDFRKHGGILVFGSGRNYRLSPLYLAYLSHAHLAGGDGFHTRYASHDSKGGWIWSSRENDAYPVIGGQYVDNPRFRRDCMERTGFWRCAAAVRDLAWEKSVDQATSLFGEVSVKLVLDGPGGMEPTLVMLSNHQYSASHIQPGGYFENLNNLKSYLRDGGVYARTAPLGAPHQWSEKPIHTGSSGYGPYIIDRYTRWDKAAGELVLWHVLSLWRGPPMSDFKKRSQYGMATTEARIPWPAGGAR
ncbi:MAG: hypothetical protein GY847_00510 [Proteobacteria bacterium]|nr:hypothetical protein [Pseudomonadota bacterium]